MLDRRCWVDTAPPRFGVESGQVVWLVDDDGVLADVEQRSFPGGARLTLHHVWNRDRTVLSRLYIEGQYGDTAPMFVAEARRPRGGWRGDELGRLLLAVISCGTVGH